jgi:dTDP-4-amino-4,6-dideoxygalactose transaminase
MDRLKEACARRRVPIVEDCAHAHGAMLQGRVVGSLGDIGCFSLYPTKILTSGVGGIITTNDSLMAEFARSLRHHGQGPSLEEIDNAGNDWLMDEVRAVLALAQLRRLPDFLAHRRGVAARYDQLLALDGRMTRAVACPGSTPAYYKYPVLLPPGVDRDLVRQRLAQLYKIEAGAVYSPPTHLMPVFRRMLGTGPGLLPRSEALLPRQICLPMHAAISAEDADRSVAALGQVLESMGHESRAP